MSKGFAFSMDWAMPPAKSPGDKFMRSSRDSFDANTPRPFISQHNFGKAHPSHDICEPKGGSPVSTGQVKFSIPNSIKTPAHDKK